MGFKVRLRDGNKASCNPKHAASADLSRDLLLVGLHPFFLLAFGRD
jgi:hypothetical protein